MSSVSYEKFLAFLDVCRNEAFLWWHSILLDSVRKWLFFWNAWNWKFLWKWQYKSAAVRWCFPTGHCWACGHHKDAEMSSVSPFSSWILLWWNRQIHECLNLKRLHRLCQTTARSCRELLLYWSEDTFLSNGNQDKGFHWCSESFPEDPACWVFFRSACCKPARCQERHLFR